MDFSSTGSLITSLMVGSVGLGLFLYGRKQTRVPHLAVGITMMVYPYFVTGTLPMLGIAVVLLGGLWALRNAGA